MSQIERNPHVGFGRQRRTPLSHKLKPYERSSP
jgi:hypothetical protein